MLCTFALTVWNECKRHKYIFATYWNSIQVAAKRFNLRFTILILIICCRFWRLMMCLSDCFVWVLTALSCTSFFWNFDKRISSECIHDQLYGDIVACAGQATDRCSFAICISALWSFKLTIYYYVTIVHIVCSPNETNNLCQVLLLHLLSVFDASEVSFGSFRFFFLFRISLSMP